MSAFRVFDKSRYESIKFDKILTLTTIFLCLSHAPLPTPIKLLVEFSATCPDVRRKFNQPPILHLRASVPPWLILLLLYLRLLF